MEDLLSVDQADFHRGHSTCDQVTALTTFIKNGSERTLKTGAVLLDLTAAYNTIWHTGLFYKLSKCLPLWCIQTVNCCQETAISGSIWKMMSVPGEGRRTVCLRALTFFNLYTNDLPVTRSRRFICAHDICCALQAETFSEIEYPPTANLDKYCHLWHLKPSTSQDCDKCFPPA